VVLGRVSAAINPAMLLARVTLGQMDGVTFVVLSLADIAGAMMGELRNREKFLYCCAW
jgi:glycerol uptake facilitator-like aquaporin